MRIRTLEIGVGLFLLAGLLALLLFLRFLRRGGMDLPAA